MKSKTNYIILFNGLGNQIGQLALYLLITEDFKLDAKLITINNRRDQAGLTEAVDTNSLQITKNILIEFWFRLAISPKTPNLIRNFLRKNSLLNIFEEPKDISFDINIIKKLASSGGVIFTGGWHNRELHDKRIETIKKLLKNNLKTSCRSKIKEQHDNNSVIGVHIRGKDYLSGQESIIYGGIATADYYLKAIEYAKKRMPNGKLLFFTDDKEYVKHIFNNSNIDFGSECSAIQDFYSLMLCDALIIGNSSFAYWSARLNENAQFVIRPHRYTNLSKNVTYPEDWIDVSHG